VHLVPAAVVRLVRTLAHELISRALFGSVRTGSCGAARLQSGEPAPPVRATTRPRASRGGTGTFGRGHAAPVEPIRPANGTRRSPTGSIRGYPTPRRAEPVIVADHERQVHPTRRCIAATCGEPVARHACCC
jgi:hypothetical protein